MLATMRQRDFSLLWFAGFISLTGTWMLNIALPITVYELTGSILAVGGLQLMRTVSGILFSMIAGVFVDRWERRQTLVVINLLLAGAILPLLLVRSAEWIWVLYVVSFLHSAGSFFCPDGKCDVALVPDPKLLGSANALNALNNNFARLIGAALGSVTILLFGFGSVVIFDMVTFIIAAGLCAGIRVISHPGKSDAETRSFSFRKFVNELMESIHLIWRTRTVRVLFLLLPLPAIGETVMYIMFVPFVTEVLRGGEFHVGGLMSAQAIGGLLGGVIISWVAMRVKAHRLLGVSAVIFGLLDFALFNYSMFFSGIMLAYALIILVGPLSVGYGASLNTLIQTNIADAYRGRVFGAFGLIQSLFSIVGVAFAGFAGETFGIVPTINVQAFAYFILGVICLITLQNEAEKDIPEP